MIDAIVHRRELKSALARSLRLFAAGPFTASVPSRAGTRRAERQAATAAGPRSGATRS
jgi:hypothetical protein